MKRDPQISEVEQYIIDYVINLRKSKGLLQRDIAEILRVSRVFITDVENPNKPPKYNIDHINALADYFGMSPKDFLPEKAFPVD